MLSRAQLVAVFIRLLNVSLNTVLQFAFAALLSKENFANIALGKSLFQSFDFTHLGTRNALDRLLPNANHIFRVKAFYSALVVTLISSSILAAFWIVLGYDYFVFVLFIFGGLFSSLTSLYKIFFRSTFDFKKFNIVSALNDNLTVLSQIAFLYLFYYIGIPFSVFGSYLLVFILLNRGKIFRAILVFYRHSKQFFHVVEELYKYGFTIFLSSILTFVVVVVDKLVVGYFYDREFLADYSFVLMFQALLIMVPSTLIEVQISKLMIVKSKRFYLKFLSLILLTICVGIVGIFLLYPFLSTLYFDKYSHLHNLILLSGLGALFSAPAQLINVYMQSNDARQYIVNSNLIATLFYFFAFAFLSYNKFDIFHLVWVKNFYYFFLFLILSYFFYRGEKLRL